MIIYLQENIGGTSQGVDAYMKSMSIQTFVSGPNAAPSNKEIEQARSVFRFVFSRIAGRVN